MGVYLYARPKRRAVSEIYQAVNTTLGEVKIEEGEKRCTLAFLAYRGEGAM